MEKIMLFWTIEKAKWVSMNTSSLPLLWLFLTYGLYNMTIYLWSIWTNFNVYMMKNEINIQLLAENETEYVHIFFNFIYKGLIYLCPNCKSLQLQESFLQK